MIEASRREGSMTGLTDNEAKEFHTIFMTSFIGFVVIAYAKKLLVPASSSFSFSFTTYRLSGLLSLRAGAVTIALR